MPYSCSTANINSVLDYDVSKAYLYVEHHCSQDADHQLRTAVEITQVLENVKSIDLQAGSWLNVIGYVRRSLPSKNKRKQADELRDMLLPQVVVQAILIWNAGALKHSDYERMLSHQQEMNKLATEIVAEHLKP